MYSTLIYDIHNYINFTNILVNFLSYFIFIFILFYVFKKQFSKKVIKAFFLLQAIMLILMFMDDLIETIKINNVFKEKKYSTINGFVYDYLPVSSYNRKNGYFYVGKVKFEVVYQHEIISKFSSDYKIKNGDNVKIDYIDGQILRFWINPR